MVRAKVIGPRGYSGSELLRWLIEHPLVEEVVPIDRRVEAPTPLSETHPYLARLCDIKVLPADDGSECDVVFLCTPDGVAMRLAPGFLKQGARVIDFSGDSRLRTPEVHRQWYQIDHLAPELLKQSVYGLPELHKESIRAAQVVANPGCYATASILALAPAVKSKLIESNGIIIDAKSGVSGAGKHPKEQFHFPELAGNFYAYKVTGHKHTPEIEQQLQDLAADPVQISFVPHLLPVSRGILCTVYAPLKTGCGESDVWEVYQEFYENAPFVRVLAVGQEASLKSVQYSNFCDLAIHIDQRNQRLIVTSVIDNLVKGASGQAVQNMNLIFWFDETAGLTSPPPYL